MTKKTAGSAVKHARHELGMTQREFALRVGVKASHIAYIEANRRRPSLSLIGRIADVLGLNPRELLLLSHPEAKSLLGEPGEPRDKKPHGVWRRFASNRMLHKRHRITRRELKVLKQISMLEDVNCSSHFLFVLNSIRQAAALPD